MMKRSVKHGLAAAMSAMIVLASCNTDEVYEVQNDGAVGFTAGIGQVATPPQYIPGTRVSGNSWEDGDAIGIYMMEHNTISMSAENKKYTIPDAATGKFAAPANEQIYYPETGEVDFMAYYPWKASGTGGIENNKYPVNVADQSTPKEIDLLWTKANNSGSGYSKDYPEVALIFNHKLTKLVLQTKAGAGVTEPLAGMKVEINGMYTQNTFDLTAGTFETATNQALLTPRTTTDGQQYEAIILPRKVENKGDVEVVFTVSDKYYVWKIPAGTEFKTGEEHIWEITLTGSGTGTGTSVIATGTITPWNSGTGGSDNAE